MRLLIRVEHDGRVVDLPPVDVPEFQPEPELGSAWNRGLDWYQTHTGTKGTATPTVRSGGLVDGLTITGGTTDGFDSTQPARLYRCHIHAVTTDAAKGHSDQTFEECLIEDLRPAANAHSDGIQIMSGDSITIRNCWIDAGSRANGALQVKTDKGDITNLLIEGNVLSGGVWYTCRFNGTSGRRVRATLTDNVFLRAGVRTPLLVRGDTVIVDGGGNRWDDGTPLSF